MSEDPSNGSVTQDKESVDRQLSEDDQKRVRDHWTWLQTYEREGVPLNLSGKNLQFKNLRRLDLRKANFQGTDLSHADLSDAKLRRANLLGAKLSRADLGGADLTAAVLTGAIMEGADLSAAVLRDADLVKAKFKDADMTVADLHGARLWEADLGEARGLVHDQLADTDLSGAVMPDDVANFPDLQSANEVARQMQPQLMGTAIVCIALWFTIWMIPDSKLLGPTTTKTLPLIDVEVPYRTYFVLAPLILFGTYVYLLLQLQAFWRHLSVLPSVFREGDELDQRVHPWPMTHFIRPYKANLKDQPRRFSSCNWWVAFFLAWLIIPFTIFQFWGRYIRLHDWSVTVLHIVVLSLITFCGAIFYRVAVNTLQPGSVEYVAKHRRKVRPVGVRGLLGWRHVLFPLAALLLLFGLSFGAICLVPDQLDMGFVRTWTSANLSQAEVSTKPRNFDQSVPDAKLLDKAGVKGASLVDVNLRNSTAVQAFMACSQIDRGDLRGANLWAADLRKCTLNGAKLQKAYLQNALFQLSQLNKAELQGSSLKAAHFEEATMQGANLEGADAYKANFSGASLEGVNFRQATCFCADFSKAHIDKANLEGANLRCADLSEVRAPAANFAGADLKCAKIQGADLSSALNLTQEAIDQAFSDSKTKLPGGLTRKNRREETCSSCEACKEKQ